MAIPISNVTRRVVYEADGTGPYAFTFEILANTDIAVYKDDALLTLTTDYTVTIASNGTGSITLVASPTGADQIAIVGNRTIQRTTDFVTGGDFFANTVNDEMDQQTIFAQQNAEGLTRALQAPQTDPTTIDMTLPRASVRANKTLAFDTDGNPTTGEAIGDNRGNWASGTVYNKRDIVKDTSNGNIYYANTSHTSRNSQPISTNADSAKWDLLVDNASAGAAQAAAEAAQDAAETAEANAETAETNAETAATAAASSASAASSSASAASTSATNAASSASTASTAATNASNSATAAATSATNASNSASAASTSASNASSSASSASTSASNASTSATNAASSATTATTKASEASTSATNAASSATASASSATAAAASAAAAAASFDAFDDIYLGAKSSDPSVDNDGNALTTGDQYFNTTANELRVYNGSTWQAASTVGGTVTSLSVTGATTLGQNLAFTGTGNRITGDFSNGTISNRVTFQTSTSNSNTSVGAIPNGTASGTNFSAFNAPDSSNASFMRIRVDGSVAYLESERNGTGSLLPMAFYTSGSERMRVDTSGNLGIGTSSPNAKLTIGGSGANRMSFIGPSGTYYAGYDGTTDTFGIASNTSIRFQTGAYVEAARIDSSGRLLVGTTTGIANGTFCVKSNYAGAEACSFQGGSNGYIVTFHNTSGTLIGSITGSTGSTTAYNTSSDYRLKENIAPMTGALATVAQLKPCTYTWKVDGSSGQGFIAHELQEVVPDCVSGEKDAVNEDGSIKPQGIDTSFLVATLTAAIQEQQAIILAQQTALTALTARVAALESN